MRKLGVVALLSLAVGYALAHFMVAYFNHWYFAEHFWLKTVLLTPLVALAFGITLLTPWAKLWRLIGVWWIVTHLLAMVPAGGPDLRGMEFVAVLDFEAAVIWVPSIALIGYGCWQSWKALRAQKAARQTVARELKLRQQLRHREHAVVAEGTPPALPSEDE